MQYIYQQMIISLIFRKWDVFTTTKEKDSNANEYFIPNTHTPSYTPPQLNWSIPIQFETVHYNFDDMGPDFLSSIFFFFISYTLFIPLSSFSLFMKSDITFILCLSCPVNKVSSSVLVPSVWLKYLIMFERLFLYYYFVEDTTPPRFAFSSVLIPPLKLFSM